MVILMMIALYAFNVHTTSLHLFTHTPTYTPTYTNTLTRAKAAAMFHLDVTPNHMFIMHFNAYYALYVLCLPVPTRYVIYSICLAIVCNKLYYSTILLFAKSEWRHVCRPY